MKRLLSMIRKDFILGFKDLFIILEIVMAIFMVLFFLFIVPEEIDVESKMYIYDSTGLFSHITQSLPKDDDGKLKKSAKSFVNSRQEVIDGIIKTKSAVGLVLKKGETTAFSVEMLKQPYTPKWLEEYLEIYINDLFSLLNPQLDAYSKSTLSKVSTKTLQENSRAEIPFNKSLLPPLYMMLCGIIGMFTMISLVGQERTDLTIRAFIVSPGKIGEFILSKHIIILFTGLLSFSIMYIPLMGIKTYPVALLIIFLTILIGSSIGILLASFFNNPMAAMIWVLLFMIIFSLPSVSLFMPGFSPLWLRVIPSFYTIFGLDAVMFSNDSTNIVKESLLVLSSMAFFSIIISSFIFTYKMGKEG